MASVLDTFGGMFLNIALILVSIVIISGVGWLSYLFIKRFRRYKEFKVIIWEKDGFGKTHESIDKAGIFVDSKTKNKRLFLKHNNVGLNPDNVPYINSGKDKVIYLLRTGLKNFRFINLRIEEPGVGITIGEEDVNWGINSYERAKKIFNQSLLLQLMPYIALFFVSMVILVLFIFLFRQLGDINQLLVATNELAQTMQAINSGTTVIPA